MRVLLSAYAFEPNSGSESGVGWNWATRLAAHHEVVVLTRATNRAKIESVAAELPEGLSFAYVHDRYREPWHWPLGLGWLAYYHWQVVGGQTALALHRDQPFDLAHHVTFASWRAPSFLYRLGIPFIWGPVGGGQSSPPGFLSILGFGGTVRELLRGVFQNLSRLDPFVRRTMNRATLVMAANTATLNFLPRKLNARKRLLLETALDERQIGDRPHPRGSPGQLRVLWVGYLNPSKALPLLIEAVAQTPASSGVEVEVVGGGPEEVRWMDLVHRHSVEDRITFLGPRRYEEVQHLYGVADALVFTSLRETSGNVLLEAMAAGLPVVCLDWSGPADLTVPDVALRIPAEKPAQVVRDLSSALQRLSGDVEFRAQLGAAGQDHVVRHHTWTKRLSAMLRYYEEAVGDSD